MKSAKYFNILHLIVYKKHTKMKIFMKGVLYNVVRTLYK